MKTVFDDTERGGVFLCFWLINTLIYSEIKIFFRRKPTMY